MFGRYPQRALFCGKTFTENGGLCPTPFSTWDTLKNNNKNSVNDAGEGITSNSREFASRTGVAHVYAPTLEHSDRRSRQREEKRNGAQKRTRTSTPLRVPAPEAGASTNSAIWATTWHVSGCCRAVNRDFQETVTQMQKAVKDRAYSRKHEKEDHSSKVWRSM